MLMTGKHSSRMRTDRKLTASRSVLTWREWSAYLEGVSAYVGVGGGGGSAF